LVVSIYEGEEKFFFINVLLLWFLRSFIFYLGLLTPIPGGTFAPFIIMGCIFGRAYGEFFLSRFQIQKARSFAIAGAAAVAASSTEFLALSLLVIEGTAELKLSLQVLLTVLFAFGVRNFLSKSIFNSIITLKKYKYIPSVLDRKIYERNLEAITKKNPELLLCSNSTIHDLYNFLKKGKEICISDFIPVIDNLEDKNFKGIIKLERLI